MDDVRRSFPRRGDFQAPSAAVKRPPANIKKWRLIVRNLPFQCSESDITQSFSSFGAIVEAVLPRSKKNPRTIAGFGFVQFADESEAKAALEQMNMTELKGRQIAVDWALPKDTYETAVHEEKACKKPRESIKFDDESDDEEIEKTEEAAAEVKADPSGSDSDSEDADSDVDEEGEEESETKTSAKRVESKPDSAVLEGRTVFVRNLSFDSSDDDLREFFSKFGTLKLAITCKYAGTDHSKGTGFVQFEQKDAADECVAAGAPDVDPGLYLHHRRLLICRALPRADAQKMDKEKREKRPNDNRNLHLMRVGLTRAGTEAAQGMSEADGRRRAAIELANREKIKNLHVFVSPTRLVLHNLPTSVDDRQLRRLCRSQLTDADVKIRECRVWRDMNRKNADGVGKSRGFAFVEFAEHRHALACLRLMNNNAQLFGDKKRPIVEFSLENRTALNAKRQRLLNSQAVLSGELAPAEKRTKKQSKGGAPTDLDETKMTLSAGGQKALPSHVGPKIRHKKRPADPKMAAKSVKPAAKRSRKQIRGEKSGGAAPPAKRKGRRDQTTKWLALA